MRSLLLASLLLCAGRVLALDASIPLAWSGAAGATNSLLLPDANRSPVGLFEQGLTGRVNVLYVLPGKKAPEGAYSGSLTLYDNGSVVTFRGSGTPGPDGSIVASWISSGKTPGTVGIKLARLFTNPQAPFLYGDATIGSRKYPLFIVPQTYSKTAPFAGSSTVPGPGSQNFFVIHPRLATGTGTGFATIGTDGLAKFAGILADGSKVSASAPVLVGGGTHFLALAAPAGKGGFFGAWAHGDRARADSDWRGAAMTAALGKPERQGLQFLVSAVRSSAAGSSLPWSRGVLHIEFELIQPNETLPQKKLANGTVTFDGRSRLVPDPRTPGDKSGILNGANASGLAVLSLTLDGLKGIAKGKVTYFNGPAVLFSSLTGALNYKSGVISGRMAPRSADETPGFFDVQAVDSP